MDMHRIKFIEYQPSGVVKLSLHKSSTMLTVARANGSIEFWDSVMETFAFINSTPVCPKKMIQDLVWIRDRIFSSDSNGTISEWKFGHTHEVNIQGFDKPICCMEKSFCESFLAVGFQDGRIKIFNVIEERELEFRSELQKQLGKILSIAWHPEGEQFACGMDNSTLAIFSVANGLCLQRITLDEYKKHSTLIWQIKFLRDNTLVTGDSMGKIQFWNGKFGTLKQGYTLHEELSDILAIYVNAKEDTIFASGVDSKVAILNRVDIDGISKWIPSGAIRIHTHDVKSIVGCEGKFILTGSVDTKIALYNWKTLDRNNTRIILPFTSKSRDTVKIAIERKILMFQMESKLQLWELSNSTIDVPINANCILEIQTKDDESLIASSISSNADYVCWSNCRVTKFYKLTWEDGCNLSKLKCMKDAPAQSCQVLVFSNTTNVLFSLTNKTLSISTLKDTRVILQHQIDFELDILKIVPSKCGQYFACSESNSSTSIFEYHTFQCISKLPSHKAKVTSLDFSPQTNYIGITFNNGEVMIYDFLSQMHTIWTKLFQDFQCQTMMKLHQIEITDLTINFLRENRLALSSYGGVCVVKLEVLSENKEISPLKPRKKKQKVEVQVPNQFEEDNFKIFPNFNSILALTQINQDEIVLVGRSWEDIQKRFPPSLYRDRYGT